MNKRYYPIVVIVFLLLVITSIVTVWALDFMEVYICSDLGGVVTMNGKPIKGVVVQLTVTGDKVYKRKTVTDAQGHFNFKAITQYSLWKKFMGEPAVISEEMYFHYAGKKYLGWESGRGDYAKDGELADHPSLNDLKCDLDKKPVQYDEVYSPITSLCTWKQQKK